jgi:Ni,Fe-hydrogenase III small subunit/formate hydrogenlyase subunit 6/NADH:ubiquinone oxidoreductase subunit I
MLEWIYRGLRKGRVTTRYPDRAEPAPPGFHGRIDVREGEGAAPGLARVCPTGAITVDAAERVALDHGRCILCGECVRAAPERFAFSPEYDTATRARAALVVGSDREPSQHEPLRAVLGERARALRRSIHVRHIDCGSDGSEEWEIQALWNPYYDIQRLGFFLTNAPRHADVLLVTGPVTAVMRAPLERTWQVMPEPKALIAVGTDACGGGLCAQDRLPVADRQPAAYRARLADRPPTAGGIDAVLPVDVYVAGSPPPPIAIMHGLLLAVGLLAPGSQEQAA